jgi:AraC-like DNA-binding protein
MARPKIQIDKGAFENLCKLQCTLEEIAGWFGCSEDTIERWCKREYNANFASVFGEKREAGRISLRRAQFKLAERSAPMAIFLGKQYLGQKDVQSVEVQKTTEASIKEIEDYFNAKQAGNP